MEIKCKHCEKIIADVDDCNPHEAAFSASYNGLQVMKTMSESCYHYFCDTTCREAWLAKIIALN